MEAATAAVRRPLWLTGLIPVVVLAVAIGLFVALDAPGLESHRRAPGGAGGRAHGAARRARSSCTCATTARTR